MVEDGMPRRRVEDCVSWRDMVEYVTAQEVQWHTVRAEALIQMSNSMEKAEIGFREAITGMQTAFAEHERWHREVLQQMITGGSTNRLAIYGMLLTALIFVVSTVLTLLSH